MPTEPQKDLVLEARELLTKATPRPWLIEPVFIAQQSGGACHFGEYRFPFQVEDGHSKTYPRETAEANASLITRAPELLRQLADEVEALRKHVADLNHDFDAAMKEADDAEGTMMRKMYGR